MLPATGTGKNRYRNACHTDRFHVPAGRYWKPALALEAKSRLDQKTKKSLTDNVWEAAGLYDAEGILFHA